MRVLVTGASGFSGSFVAASLAASGHTVTGLYRRETPFLACIERARDLSLVRCALVNAGTLQGSFDAVVHTAATSPAAGIDDAQILRDNRDGTAALIAAAEAWECRSFVFFSSLSIYGDITVPVLDETAPFVNPTVYGVTKREGETMLAARAPHLPGLALRLPGVLGRGAHRNWLSGVAAKLRAGEIVQAFSLGAPFNNAVHIADIAALICTVISRGWNGFDAVVLGASGTISVRAAIERLASGLGVLARIEAIPPAKPGFILSSERAMARWGYRSMDIGAMIERYAGELRADTPQPRRRKRLT